MKPLGVRWHRPDAGGVLSTCRMEHGVLLKPVVAEAPPIVRGEPPPLHGGPLTLVRFLREHVMLKRK